MRDTYESTSNDTPFLASETEDQGPPAPGFSSESASWYERESPFLSLNRGPGNEVALSVGETAGAEHLPEAEDPALQTWTSDGYAEQEAPGLTFYGEEPAYAAAPQMENEDLGQASLKKLLAKGYWTAAVGIAIILGERDRSKITNMLFWARHPELNGQKIPLGNKKLAAEWKAIHDKLVLPPLGPVSPGAVSPTAVPSEQKSVDTLIIDIFNSEMQVLTAWSGALTQFQVVMSSHSDAEGVPDFVGAVMKHVGDQVITKIAGQVPGVSYAKDVLDKVVKEYERAREARTSAQLRDFLVRFTAELTLAMNDLGRGFGDYKHLVETAYAKAGPEEKKQYQKALADHLNALDRNWTNLTNVFLLICQEWIRNTTYKEYRVSNPAFVRISVNKDYSVRKVEILCPGGQKIAEQLLKNTGGTGLRTHSWPVPRRFLYFADSSSWPNAIINLTTDGRWAQIGNIAENSSVGAVVLDFIRRNGLAASTKVTGA